MSTHPMSRRVHELADYFLRTQSAGPDLRKVAAELDRLHAREAELVAALRELVDDTQKLYAAGRVPALTWIRASNLAALDSTGGAQ